MKYEHNFLDECGNDEIKVFRKRMVSHILATDMAKHMEDLAQFKNRTAELEITLEKNNGRDFIDRTDDGSLFDSQG